MIFLLAMIELISGAGQSCSVATRTASQLGFFDFFIDEDRLHFLLTF